MRTPLSPSRASDHLHHDDGARGAPGKRPLTRLAPVQQRAAEPVQLRRADPPGRDHDDPFGLHFGGIEFLGVTLTGNSGPDDFRALEPKLGARLALFRAAAAQGPDALLAIFIANGVVVDPHNRADVLAVADAYIRYVELDGMAGESERHGHDDPHPQGLGKGKAGGDPTLGALADQVGGWGMAVELGHYYEVELGVHIPTEIPELTIDLGGKFGFTKQADGEQELELELSTGVSFELGDFLKVSKRRLIDVKLQAAKGASFRDAFEDCIKQSVRAILIAAGVEDQLRDLRRMAVDGPTIEDWASAFGNTLTTLWGGQAQLASCAIAKLGGHDVVEVVDAYFAYFWDNTATGFDVSIHQETSVKIGPGESGIKLDAGLGVKDGIGDDEPSLYAELGGRGTVETYQGGPKISLYGKAELDNEGPHFMVGFEVEGPWNGSALFVAASALALEPSFREGLGGLIGEGDGDADGWTAALNLFGEALREAATSAFASAVGLTHTMSVAVEYTFGRGGTENVKATAKSKTEDELDLKVFDAKASMGTFLDVTASYQDAATKARVIH